MAGHRRTPAPLGHGRPPERFAELAWARGRPAEVAAQLEGAVRSLEGVEGLDVCIRRARLRTDLADHYAELGRIDSAVKAYEYARADLRKAGMDDRARRVERRLEALRADAGPVVR